MLGSISDLNTGCGAVILVVKILFACPAPYEFKKSQTNRFCMVTAHSEQKVPVIIPR